MRRALVTGAARGIGRAAARRLPAEDFAGIAVAGDVAGWKGPSPSRPGAGRS